MVAGRQLPVLSDMIRGPSAQAMGAPAPDLDTIWFARATTWQWCTVMAALGRPLQTARWNPVVVSFATNCTLLHHQSGRAPIQSRTAWPRPPSTMSKRVPGVPVGEHNRPVLRCRPLLAAEVVARRRSPMTPTPTSCHLGVRRGIVDRRWLRIVRRSISGQQEWRVLMHLLPRYGSCW